MATRAKRHKDVDFEISSSGRGRVGNFKTFNEAAAVALDNAIATGSSTLDVIVLSRAGDAWLGGEDYD